MNILTRPSWYRHRRYLHFDEPLGYKKAVQLATNPLAVAKHSFWPLISFNISTKKIQCSDGEIKKTTKPRLISYAAHSDSHIFSYYSHTLSIAYEDRLNLDGISDSVLAFRSLGKNNIDFAVDAFDEIRRIGDCSAIALDISGFFDNIDHGLLYKQWKDLLGEDHLPSDHYAIFKAITKYSRADRSLLFEALGISPHNPRSGNRRRVCSPSVFRSTVRKLGHIKINQDPHGIPQGTAISALLSNIYMLDFDAYAKTLTARHNGKYMRYCDDILLIVPREEADSITTKISNKISDLKLKINESKTNACLFERSESEPELQTVNRPLQYLGFLFDGDRVLIRSAAFAKFSNRMNRGVSLAKQTMHSRNKERANSGNQSRDIYRKKIYSRYSHLGARNFLRYGYKAARLFGSKDIKKQLRPLWGRLQKLLTQ